jgi:hypothetical protein
VILPPGGGGTDGTEPRTGVPGSGSGQATRAPQVTEAASTGGVFGIVTALVASAADSAGRVISTDAAVAVASGFGFPIALALLVLLFLVIQPRVDKRDPKLASAPHGLTDTLVAFEDDPR